MNANGNDIRKKTTKILDQADFKVPFEHTYRCLREAVADLRVLSLFVVQWATSIYRDGLHRVYTACRVLRKCYSEGIDVDSVLLTFISDPPSGHGVDFSLVFKLVAELIRSNHFSVAQFFQSLIATGALSALHDNSHLSPSASTGPLLLSHSQPYERLALLASVISTHDLPGPVSTLRELLLSNAGSGVPNEDESIQTVVEMLHIAMSRQDAAADLAESVLNLSIPARSAISHWIRAHMQSYCTLHGKQVEPSDPNRALSHQFHVARSVLETIADFTMLADVVGLVIGAADSDALASVAETLHMHLHCLAAIGALRPLYQAVLGRYQVLRVQEQLGKRLICAIRDLSGTLGVDRPVLQQLGTDLIRCTQRDTLAMCSPASDNAVDTLQIGVDTDDEIDRILSSGTTMDDQMMPRVFKRIIARAHKDESEQRARVGGWLCRLQSFDMISFNRLLAGWVVTLLSDVRQLALQLLPTLISSGCFSMAAFVLCAERCRQDKDRAFCCHLDLDILETIFAPASTHSGASVQVAYRDHLERKTYAMLSSSDILSRFERLVAECALTAEPALEERLSSFVDNSAFTRFLKVAAVENAPLLESSLGLTSPESTSKVLPVASHVLSSLIDPLGQLRKFYLINTPNSNQLTDPGLSTLPRDEQVPMLLDIADELSLTFCQLQMRVLLSSSLAVGSEKDDAATKLFHAVSKAADKSGSVWPNLIENLDGRITQQIRQVAESQLFAAMSVVEKDEPRNISDGAIEKLLRIVDCLSPASAMQSFQPAGAVLTDKLRALLDALSTGADEGKRGPTISDTQRIYVWVQALLHLATLYKPPSAAVAKTPSELTTFATTLALLLNHPKLQYSPTTLEYLFDVAAYFSDDLMDEQRVQISRSEFVTSNDRTINFLFGSTQSPDAWLGLVTSNIVPSVPPTPSSATSMASPLPPRPGPNQLARQPSNLQSRTGTPAQQRPGGGPPLQQKTFNPPVPYPLRRWEIIDLGGPQNPNAALQPNGLAANDTAISLTLFGARKVG